MNKIRDALASLHRLQGRDYRPDFLVAINDFAVSQGLDYSAMDKDERHILVKRWEKR